MDESELIFPISLGARDEYTSGGPGQRRETDSDSDDQSSVSLEEKKEKGSNAYYSEVLLSLMADLSMGYDPSNLPQYAMSVFPSFWEDMFPGSLNHLMVILFGSNSELDSCQISMHKWLDEHFDCQPTRPHIRTTMNMIDESIFGSELEMIRALVAPLRGDMTHRVFWLHSRPYYAKDLCDEVEASMRLIEKFQEDLVAGQVVPDQHQPIHSKMIIGPDRDSLWSLRQHRLDASAATLAWVGWLKGDLEFTVLYHFYRSHLIDVDAMQAFEMGFIPPAENKFPSHVLEGLPNTLPVWSCHGGDTTVFDLIFKTALWLGLARGFPALHLFCDMVKHFTLHKPYRAITYERAKFLQQLVRMRVHSVSIRLPSEEAPFPYKDREFSDKNPDYFIDVAKSHVVMAKELEKKLTLIERPRLSGDLAKYKLRDPPCTPRDTLKRRNTIAGSYPMDVESKNTVSEDLPKRIRTISFNSPFTASCPPSRPIPIPKNDDQSVFVDDDMSRYNAW